jgi:hypothetical protein
MNETQAKARANGIAAVEIAFLCPTKGRFVGCSDCPYQSRAYDTGCFDDGID